MSGRHGSRQRRRVVLAGRLCAAAVALAWSAGGIRAAGEDGPVPLRLRDVRWQALPEAVRSVVVAPDQRIWYQVANHTWPVEGDLDRVRGSIEREFGRASPQLYGARPVLFEPGGRVWFTCSPGQNVLLGYDGASWVQRKIAQKGMYFFGNCPGNGRRYRCDYNLFVAGTAFFIDSLGVHTFDGGQWAYLKLKDTSGGAHTSPRLLPEPDGQGCVAFLAGEPLGVWRWRKGKWQHMTLALPGVVNPNPGQSTPIVEAAPVAGGLWVQHHAGTVWFQPFPSGEGNTAARQFARLLKRLGDDRWPVREAATKEMIALGPSVRPLIAEALAKSEDLEVKLRLKRVLAAFRSIRAPAPKPVTFGPYALARPGIRHCGHDGSIYVAAGTITRKGGQGEQGPGLVVVGPERVRALRGSDLAGPWRLGGVEDSGPVPAGAGKLWLPGRPPRLLDVHQGKFVDRIPVADFHWIHAVAADGTVYVSRRQAGQNGSRPIMAYRPGAPDDRRLIPTAAMQVAEAAPFCVASDGAVWAHAPDGRVVRFDGKTWQAVPAVPKTNKAGFLVPGRRGAVLAQLDAKYYLIHAGRVCAGDSICEVVRSNSDVVLDAFPPGRQTARWHAQLSIASDKAGSIWLARAGRLRVLLDGRWVDPAMALRAAGHLTARVAYLSPVGDGATMYLTDLSEWRFFAWVEGGTIRLKPAPRAVHAYRVHEYVRGRDGSLWLSGVDRRPDGRTHCEFAMQLTEKGLAHRIEGVGQPRLVDRGGNVWLGYLGDQCPAEFSIWREGRVAGKLEIPSPADQVHLVSHRPGEVLAWTPFGLFDLRAGDADRPARFAVEAVYHGQGMAGRVRRVAYSKLGYLVVARSADADGRHHLYLLRLPRTKD